MRFFFQREFYERLKTEPAAMKAVLDAISDHARSGAVTRGRVGNGRSDCSDAEGGLSYFRAAAVTLYLAEALLLTDSSAG